MATFLLVHGAFQGGWVWEETARALRSRGHEAFAPTLAGAGEKAHLLSPEAGVATWLEDLRAEMFYKNLRDVVLVGHSYSGLLAGALAGLMERRISRLVFVDAMIPEAGKSFLDLAGPGFQETLRRHMKNERLVGPWSMDVFGVFCEEEKRWFGPRLTPFPLSAFTFVHDGKILPEKTPVSYVRCLRNDNPLLDAMAGKAESLGWLRLDLDAHHCPMVTAPQELARVLGGLASHAIRSAKRTQGEAAGSDVRQTEIKAGAGVDCRRGPKG